MCLSKLNELYMLHTNYKSITLTKRKQCCKPFGKTLSVFGTVNWFSFSNNEAMNNKSPIPQSSNLPVGVGGILSVFAILSISWTLIFKQV